MTDMSTMNADRIKVVQLYYVRAAAYLGFARSELSPPDVVHLR